MSIDVNKTSTKVTPSPLFLFSPINLSLYPAARHKRFANICVIFEMARFSTPSASFFLSSSVTGKSFGDKERNVAYKGERQLRGEAAVSIFGRRRGGWSCR